ncbi:MAG TPA: hypothetical protein PKC39_12055 [Ferruginibacter sp.]|nr:hypothetical protein [Ferruginibacter sp.]HMP21683.1 hypothetical protein [Ferruginibacter sp.]
MQRTVVSASTFEEADNHVSYWLDKSTTERLNAACFIINNLFSVSPDTKMRKDVLTARKHSDG